MSEVQPDARILVLRFSSAGDVVLTSPAVHALKTAWPNCTIIYAVKEAYAPLVAHDPNIDKVFTLTKGEGPWSFSRRLRALGFDAILDLHGKMRSKLLRAFLPGPRVVWTKRPWQDNVPVRLGLRTYKAEKPIADRYHEAVEDLVGTSLPRGHLRYFVGEDDRQVAQEAFEARGLQDAGPFVGMSPGANWNTKRWPVERFAELANEANEAGYRVLVTGSGSEAHLGARLAALAPDAVDLTGALPIGALGAVIEKCTAFVGNDSGPMHIARALGVPTLAFFGSTDPAQFEFGDHRMLYTQAECSPCHFYGRSRCPKGHFRCMMDIQVSGAWETLQPLLDGERRAFVHA